jgi:hypothetical protein
MNYFSYEVMGKEKVKGFQEEGMRNQAVHRSGVSKKFLLNRLSKLIVGLVAILGILELLR